MEQSIPSDASRKVERFGSLCAERAYAFFVH